jgi:hypothetical protein
MHSKNDQWDAVQEAFAIAAQRSNPPTAEEVTMVAFAGRPDMNAADLSPKIEELVAFVNGQLHTD